MLITEEPRRDASGRRFERGAEAGAVLDGLWPDAVQLLRELVRIPSGRGEEKPIQAFVASLFRSRGLEVSEVEIDPERLKNVRGFSPSSSPYGGRPNVAAVLRGTGGGRSLAVNFHADTAPAGPGETWKTDPLGAELSEGKIYGRGAWDDKAGAALAFFVLDALRASGTRLRGDVVFHSVIEDEHTGNGTLALVERGFGADGAILLDGAYGPRAILGHPGHTTFEVTAYGKAAPSCRSDTGESAIEKAFAMIQRLRALERTLNAEVSGPWSHIAHPIHFNVGTITGGEWPGAVAAKCSFVAQMSFLPPFTLRSFRERIRQEIAAVSDEGAWGKGPPAAVDFFDLATEPVRLDGPSEFLTCLDEACRDVFDQPLARTLATGWCDLRHFSLFKPTPGCLFGPGKGANAHRPDEYYEAGELLPHARVLVDFLKRWCGAEAG